MRRGGVCVVEVGEQVEEPGFFVGDLSVVVLVAEGDCVAGVVGVGGEDELRGRIVVLVGRVAGGDVDVEFFWIAGPHG